MKKARFNPFVSSQIESLPYIFKEKADNWDNLMRRIQELNYRGTILGAQGTGKTTLVEGLILRLQEQGFFIQYKKLSFSQRNFSKNELLNFLKRMNSQTIVIIDGADLMPGFLWYILKVQFAAARGLIVTAHQKIRLPLIFHCQADLDVLDQILFNLIGDERLFIQDVTQKLYDLHKGNIRLVLRDLYDLYSDPAKLKMCKI